MTTYRDLVSQYPRGMKWAFALTLQGIPDIFSCGMAAWGTINGRSTDRPGTLTTRDFQLSFRSDPQNPLVTGSGLSVTLIDDGTDYLNTLFAPDYEGSYTHLKQTLTAASASTTATVENASQISIGYAYAGLETFNVTARDTVANTLTVTRARFDTVRRTFNYVGGRGVKITTSPRLMEGRIAEIWVAPVDSATGAAIVSDAAPIWAGVLKQVRQSDESIELQLEPLDSILQTAWPSVLPAGALYQRLNQFNLNYGHWTMRIATLGYNGSVTNTEYRDLQLGEYNNVGTFTVATPATGMYSLQYIVKLIQDTLANYLATTTDEPFYGAGNRPFKNRISMAVVQVDEDRLKVVGQLSPNAATLGTGGSLTARIEFRDNVGIFTKIGRFSPLEIGSREQVLKNLRNNYTYITEGDDSIDLYCDNPDYPFSVAFKDYLSGNSQGYVRIADGSDVEIIAYTGVTIDTNDKRKVTITGCIRGLGGTKPRKWGYDDDARTSVQTKATVTQLLMMSSPMGFSAGLTPLYMDQIVGGLLMSTTDPGQQGGTYHDYLYGYGMGMQMPARYVDYEGMQAIAYATGSFQANRFWVDEGGKGKDQFSELLKLAGMYLVAKRFTRGGTQYFGLSLETITVPAYTQYNDTFTDTERRSGSEVEKDHNNRLLINSVMIKPFGPTSWGQKESDGQPLYEWDEWSIAEHGASKTLEFKPSVFFNTFDDRTLGLSFQGRDAQAAQLTSSASRWFGAFGRGNYILSCEAAAPVGYKYQIGDRILYSFSGVRNPQGSLGMTGSVGKVTAIEHYYGSRAKTHISARLAYEDVSELAPCARVTAITSSTLTVDANYFSATSQFIPFTTTRGATDAEWFDPIDYGGNIYCIIWTEGEYAASVASFQVTSRTGNTLTVNTNMTALTVATNLGLGKRTIMSFAVYSASLGTSLQRQYAHAASNSSPPLLDSTNAAKEYF